MHDTDANQTLGSMTVSVIDDHPDLCYGVLARLPQSSPLFLAGVKAATVQDFLAIEQQAHKRTDVVLLDLTLKDGSSPSENVKALKSDGYAVVIYTGEERSERLHGTLGIGADAVVRKEEAECLEDALLAVMHGDHSWVSPLMAEIVLDAPGPKISPAQVETLRLYATGLTAQQIASTRGCALETIKSYLKAVKVRYAEHGDAVYTRSDLLRVALRDKFVDPDWFRHENSV